MFTGISECMGTITSVGSVNGIVEFQVKSPISGELKIDQSVMHDGVCLTVTAVEGNTHSVQAIPETLSKTNLGQWAENTQVNLERSMPANGRFDGHVVQGHVDCTARVSKVLNEPGQLQLWFNHEADKGITVQKGSICVNGISLTVVNSSDDEFSVAIIPYTLEHTNLGELTPGDTVNIEFDIIGKYLQKLNR